MDIVDCSCVVQLPRRLGGLVFDICQCAAGKRSDTEISVAGCGVRKRVVDGVT